jgi:hypothetical protein
VQNDDPFSSPQHPAKESECVLLPLEQPEQSPAPPEEETDYTADEAAVVKKRLQALGYV